MKIGSPEAIRITKSAALCFLFICLILLPTLDLLLKIDRAPLLNEKRLPASFPRYGGLDRLREFISGFTAYFDDHFGFRRRLVRTNNHWRHELFGSTETTVLEGRDGWLYYSGADMLDNYVGLLNFKQNELEAWRAVLEKRRDWLARQGCKYLFVMAPDKQSVYPEHLPVWCPKPVRPGKAEQFFQYMKAHADIPVLDLRPALREAKATNIVFLKTDTHWNNFGAFVGYREVITALAKQGFGVKLFDPDAYKTTWATPNPGDLVTLMGAGGFTEPEQPSCIPEACLPALIESEQASLVPKKWTKDTVPTITRNAAGKGKVIVFHDSFAMPWRSFLGRHFKEVIYVWEPPLEPDLIRREKPDVVITEMVERTFQNEEPQKLMAKDRLD